jgi:hypothetical protein
MHGTWRGWSGTITGGWRIGCGGTEEKSGRGKSMNQTERIAEAKERVLTTAKAYIDFNQSPSPHDGLEGFGVYVDLLNAVETLSALELEAHRIGD